MSPYGAAPHALGDALLRPFRPGEAAALAPLCVAMEPLRRLGYRAAGLAGYFERPDPALTRYVIERDDQQAGVLAIRSPWLRGPTIELLLILPIAQGKGLGHRLIAWTAAHAESDNLWATVSDFNEPARRFYAACGFREVAELPDLVSPGVAEILLRRVRVTP